jgi:hypothetical protein
MQELQRYDLSNLTTHKPMLNREREDMVAAKLARVIAKAAGASQGSLDLK